MPVQYPMGCDEKNICIYPCRCGRIDVSHMGQVMVTGPVVGGPQHFGV